MALTDTFVKQVKPTGSPAGDKHSDGGEMYLLVKSSDQKNAGAVEPIPRCRCRRAHKVGECWSDKGDARTGQTS